MSGPHAKAALVRAGAQGAGAGAPTGGLVLAHGRGASAGDILALGVAVAPPGTALIAPEAAGHSWWPVSFLAPMAELQPWLDSALEAMDRAVGALTAEGLPPERIALAGFSQGACLALEYAARRGGPWRGVIALSGGLMGTADTGGAPEPGLYGHAPKRMEQAGRLDGVPVLLACHDRDPHIPAARVRETARVLSGLGAAVDMRLHAGAGHGTGPGDLEAARALLQR
ncbi:MAG: dienelactone hydrolase family protein [Rhodobacteraceae bacterium]|nr:dienelactone hydrolase family protein [Paracoccaceae bacterium]